MKPSPAAAPSLPCRPACSSRRRRGARSVRAPIPRCAPGHSASRRPLPLLGLALLSLTQHTPPPPPSPPALYRHVPPRLRLLTLAIQRVLMWPSPPCCNPAGGPQALRPVQPAQGHPDPLPDRRERQVAHGGCPPWHSHRRPAPPRDAVQAGRQPRLAATGGAQSVIAVPGCSGPPQLPSSCARGVHQAQAGWRRLTPFALAKVAGRDRSCTLPSTRCHARRCVAGAGRT